MDQPFPTLLKSIGNALNAAVRVSEYELIPRNLDSKLNWIWIDSFTGSWSHLQDTLDFGNSLNLKVCIVSPELQGRHSSVEVNEIKTLLAGSNKLEGTYVCTKIPEVWDDL